MKSYGTSRNLTEPHGVPWNLVQPCLLAILSLAPYIYVRLQWLEPSLVLFCSNCLQLHKYADSLNH
jgi:hypothetical protein